MPRELSLAVVGAGYDNKTGPKRTFEIALCLPGERVELVPEPKNPADPNAVAVFSARGIQIGYVRAERAPYIRLALGRSEVTAIFQQAEPWGAIVRVALDGGEPRLPKNAEAPAPIEPRKQADEQDWWPDPEWPDE